MRVTRANAWQAGNLLFFSILVSFICSTHVLARENQPLVTTAQRQQMWFIAQNKLKARINSQVRHWLPISMPVTVDTRKYQLADKLDVLYLEGFLTRTGQSLEITTPEYVVVPAYEFNLSPKGKAIFDPDLGFSVAELRFVKLEKIVWPVDGDMRLVVGVFRYRYASVPEWIWAPAFEHYLDAGHMRENLQAGYQAEFSMKYDNQRWVIDQVHF